MGGKCQPRSAGNEVCDIGTDEAEIVQSAVESRAPIASTQTRRAPELPHDLGLLAVCAHPDDESFGLGAVIDAFGKVGNQVRLLCFTHGEQSTLGISSRPLYEVRSEELAAAAAVLGVSATTLLSYPDGHLGDVAPDALVRDVEEAMNDTQILLVFDEGGVTGHLDHQRATAAALLVARLRGLRVIAWTLPDGVAKQLNAEFATTFVGRNASEIDLVIEVDRSSQRKAIACHRSQSQDNPVLWRRLELLGNLEYLRWLHQ